MNGKDLIIYILENNLENEPVFKDETFVGFLPISDVAIRLDVGIATIYAWIDQGKLDYIQIGSRYLIADNFKIKGIINEIKRKE